MANLDLVKHPNVGKYFLGADANIPRWLITVVRFSDREKESFGIGYRSLAAQDVLGF